MTWEIYRGRVGLSENFEYLQNGHLKGNHVKLGLLKQQGLINPHTRKNACAIQKWVVPPWLIHRGVYPPMNQPPQRKSCFFVNTNSSKSRHAGWNCYFSWMLINPGCLQLFPPLCCSLNCVFTAHSWKPHWIGSTLMATSMDFRSTTLWEAHQGCLWWGHVNNRHGPPYLINPLVP